MTKRRRARELCLQSLYLSDLTLLKPERLLVITQSDPAGNEDKVFVFYKKLFMASINSMEKIDGIIKNIARNWDISRMAAVDKSILRMAVCEMAILKEAPIAVIIDEAIELAKKYSTDKSGKFVNGVLDNIAKSLPASYSRLRRDKQTLRSSDDQNFKKRS
ncbi:MAG: transcription antitermination factor NusB [Syntrophaceae bacterium]|nr:transcription antitermination factor NusB [Syntrophaceae bacterium]